MKRKINRRKGRRFSEGGGSIKGWVGRNMEGHRLRLGQITYNKPENSIKNNKHIYYQKVYRFKENFKDLASKRPVKQKKTI